MDEERAQVQDTQTDAEPDESASKDEEIHLVVGFPRQSVQASQTPAFWTSPE